MSKPSVITEEFKAIQTALEALEPLSEAQRKFAVSMILSRLGMASAPAVAGVDPPFRPAASHGTNHAAPKDFLKQKNPQTDLERLVCLAYYLSNNRDTPQFTTRDITKINAEAGGQDFANAATTARNGVAQSKWLSKAGGGKKRITNLGEAVVDALPDRDKLKQTLVAAPKRSAKRKKRKTKS